MKIPHLSACALALLPLSAMAQNCQQIAADAERLACYDRINGRPDSAQAYQLAAPVSAPNSPPAAPGAAGASAKASANTSASKWTGQSFAERFQLDENDPDDLFKIRAHLPVYVLPISWRQHVNRDPSSPNPRNSAHGAGENDKRVEAKFQLSLKTMMMANLFGSTADWWAAYTQQSFWQVYNAEDSRPFRETNYQPETFVTWPVKLGPEWLQLRMLNLGLVHQSNGQSDPLSRSWNRVYLTMGATSGNLSLFVKPWWRVREEVSTDNNPDISDYAGRIELQAVYGFGQHILSATLQNNLKFNSSTPNRSNIQIEWAFPLLGELHGYVRGFAGHADSLQNYNFRNQGIGLGVSLVQWR